VQEMKKRSKNKTAEIFFFIIFTSSA